MTCCICDTGADETASIICDRCERRHHELRGALENLVSELRNAQGPRFALGMKLSVAMNIAERALGTRAVDRV